jgi:hypothetical protein
MGLIGCPTMLVSNYQSMLHNIPEERRSHRIYYKLRQGPGYSKILYWLSSVIHHEYSDGTLIQTTVAISAILSNLCAVKLGFYIPLIYIFLGSMHFY